MWLFLEDLGSTGSKKSKLMGFRRVLSRHAQTLWNRCEPSGCKVEAAGIGKRHSTGCRWSVHLSAPFSTHHRHDTQVNNICKGKFLPGKIMVKAIIWKPARKIDSYS